MKYFCRSMSHRWLCDDVSTRIMGENHRREASSSAESRQTTSGIPFDSLSLSLLFSLLSCWCSWSVSCPFFLGMFAWDKIHAKRIKAQKKGQRNVFSFPYSLYHLWSVLLSLFLLMFLFCLPFCWCLFSLQSFVVVLNSRHQLVMFSQQEGSLNYGLFSYDWISRNCH